MVDRLSVKRADRALTVLKLAHVFMHVFTLAPDHGGIGTARASVPKTFMVQSHVLARVLRPDKGTFTFSNIIPEISCEFAQILNLNGSVTIQFAPVIPSALVCAIADGYSSWTYEFAGIWDVVGRCGPVSFLEQCASLELVILPDAFELSDFAFR